MKEDRRSRRDEAWRLVSEKLGLDRLRNMARDDGSIAEAQVDLALYRDRPADLDSPVSEHCWLNRYVAHASTQVASNKAYHMIAGLILAAQTCPNWYVVRNTFLADTKANLWGLCIGYSGQAQKSLAVDEVAKKMLADVEPRFIGGDPASEEALVKSLRSDPVQAIFYSEFSSFLSNTSGSALSNYRAKIPDAMTQIFDGHTINKPYSKTRMVAENPRLSLLAACTPIHLETHTTQGMWEGGFMSRKFYAYAHREREMYVSTYDEDRRNALIQWMTDTITWYRGHADDHNILSPCTGMNADTFRCWRAWVTCISHEARSLPSQLQGVASRIPLLAAKIASILAWIMGYPQSGYAGGWEMYPHFVFPAIRMAELSWQSAKAVGQHIAPTKEAQMKRAVLQSIDEKWTPLGTILSRVQMLKWGTQKCLETLREEGKVEAAAQGGGAFWRRIPGGEPIPYIDMTDSVPPPPPTTPTVAAEPPPDAPPDSQPPPPPTETRPGAQV